jgi:ankyrin repeat protein
MRYFNPAFILLILSLCIPCSLWAAQASPEIDIPAGGASLPGPDTFSSPEEAAAATDRQPFVYVGSANIDWTPLHDDIRHHRIAAVRAAVAANPAVVNTPNAVKGWTPIYVAAMWGRMDALRILVDVPGADLEVRSKRGGTALLAAAWWGRTEAVQFLVERGASTSIQNLAGDTVLSIARRRCPDVVPWLTQRGITE